MGAPSPRPRRAVWAVAVGVVCLILLFAGTKLLLQIRARNHIARERTSLSPEPARQEMTGEVECEEDLDSPSVPDPQRAAVVPYASEPSLALVIDDWGYDWEAAEAFLQIPAPLTVAILPHLRGSAEYAERAREAGFDVLVHLPLEPLGGYRVDEAGMITTTMSDNEIRSEVEAAIAAVPGAIGVNNHMGSKATADSRVMQTVLGAVWDAGLIFLDSRTTPDSRGYEIASDMGLAALRNRIFIDDVDDVTVVKERLLTAARTAQKEGFAVAIGHVRPATAEAIIGLLPAIEEMGVRLVRVSEFFERIEVAGAYPWVSRSVQVVASESEDENDQRLAHEASDVWPYVSSLSESEPVEKIEEQSTEEPQESVARERNGDDDQQSSCSATEEAT